jgi:uncharacterized protein (TIGR02147 family)
MSYQDYHEILNLELERRKFANSAYSLRAYARDLGLSAPRLSQVLSKKSGLSFTNAQEIAQRLKLSEDQTNWFCDSAGAASARSASEKKEFLHRITLYKREAKKFKEIHLEYFKVIADWYHFAILEMTYLSEFKNSEVWIAKKLGITTTEVSTAIERMLKLNLLTEKDGKLIDTFKFLATPSDVPSVALKKFNTQLMKKATEALHEQDLSEREISSNIFSVDKEKIPELKDRIRDFRRDLGRFASESTEKNAVYCLGIQLHQLTKDLP